MRRALPVFFSIFLLFVALAETAHFHEQSCDAPCPAVCLGSSCGAYCHDSDLKRSMAPLELLIPAVPASETLFVHRLSEDEIFHPPAV